MKKIMLALLLAALTTHAAEIVGTINITRMVKVSSGAVTDGGNVSWIDATQNQTVTDQQGIRTLKRSMAEITFTDKSILRINERTDMVVQQTNNLRNIKLKEGAVWIKVAKGSKTTVQTPTTTATAKGTIFIVTVKADGSTQVTVLEGTVDVMPNYNINSNIPATEVNAGETTNVTIINLIDGAKIGPNDVKIFTSLIPTALLPVELGGTVQGWTSALTSVANGTMVTTGTEIGQLISQYIQEDNAIGTNLPMMINGFISDPNIRKSFMDIARAKVETPVKLALLPGQTISSYKALHANDDMARLYNLTTDQVNLIKKVLSIDTVPELIDTIIKNSNSTNSTINWSNYSQVRQATITPISNLAPTNNDTSYRLIDKNKSSLAIVGIGAIASLLTNGCDWRTELVDNDGKIVKKYVRPNITGNAFAFSGDPLFAGAKTVIIGRLGKSIYTVESNYLIVKDKKSSQKFDSVALFEHPINDNISAFIGRKRYQAGPVIRNLKSTQLIFDRYTGAGLSYQKDKVNAEAAWLYDSNPLGAGAERGATAHISAEVKGTVIGVNYLNAGSVKPGNGYTGSLSAPLIKNYLEGYTEVGKGVDGNKLETYGLYFPAIYQKYDIDLFLEYGSHVGIGSATSLCASRLVNDNLDFRVYADLNEKGKTSINGGLVWNFDITNNHNKN
jgi:hypothetical protein